jgi:glycosyltransferase involved in cell wall biosynthesis
MLSQAQPKPQPGLHDDGHAAERRQCVFVLPAAEIPCGVEGFTRELVNSLQVGDTTHQYEVLPISGAWRELGAIARAMGRANVIVFSFPLIAWKRVIALPWCLLLIAFAARKQVIVFLHEWAAMNVLRRVVLFPFVALGDVIIMLAPFVRDGLANDPWVRWARSKCRLALHAPPIERPLDRVPSELARQLESRKERGDLLIGYFGALYKGKEPVGLLEVCDYLRARGVHATVAFIGGFPKSLDRFEDEFRHQIEERNLQKNVIITGHIRDDGKLFALLERMDVFLYLFPEGLTTRRSSVLTSVESGRPVIVNAPSKPNELAHHPGYTSLVKSGAIVLLPRDASTAEVAQRILEVAAAQTPDRPNIDFREWWRASARSVAEIVFPASLMAVR